MVAFSLWFSALINENSKQGFLMYFCTSGSVGLFHLSFRQVTFNTPFTRTAAVFLHAWQPGFISDSPQHFVFDNPDFDLRAMLYALSAKLEARGLNRGTSCHWVPPFVFEADVVEAYCCYVPADLASWFWHCSSAGFWV